MRYCKQSDKGIELLNCVETGTDPTRKVRRQKTISILEKVTSLVSKKPREKHYRWLYNQLERTGGSKRLSQMITWEYDNK